ncbi:MAG: response regulator [Planctomycetes bacterium]|nr:response regulator [Planctomycetota bacterium]
MLNSVNRIPPLVAIVDDEEATARALRRLLRSAGFDAVTYASGASFFGSLGSTQPDCVILDVHMPGMDGIEVQRRLAEINPRIPVLFLTGHDSAETRQLALSGGAVAYFTKPVDAQNLIDAINSALKGPTSP